MKTKNNFNGSAMVEFCLGVLLTLPFFFLSLELLQIAAFRHRTLTFTRLGLDLQTSGLVDSLVLSSLLEKETSRMENKDLKISWRQTRFLETPASHFYNLKSSFTEARYESKMIRNILGFPLVWRDQLIAVQNE